MKSDRYLVLKLCIPVAVQKKKKGIEKYSVRKRKEDKLSRDFLCALQHDLPRLDKSTKHALPITLSHNYLLNATSVPTARIERGQWAWHICLFGEFRKGRMI